MKIKLAEALLRRKELQNKVERLKVINVQGLFDVKVKRTNVTESVDDIVAQVSKISMQQVTSAYDYHAKHLRLIDAVIQQANWTTEIDVEKQTMEDFTDPYVEK